MMVAINGSIDLTVLFESFSLLLWRLNFLELKMRAAHSSFSLFICGFLGFFLVVLGVVPHVPVKVRAT